MMEYEMEELVPIVGRLAEKYTAHESTSITYEKAEQLMGAVLYCIREFRESGAALPASEKRVPPELAYETGAAYVKEKTEKALALYNRSVQEFCCYGNQCLYDTFVRGLPEFFRWYDSRFEPQNTILTLDYPVLKDLSGYAGIDRISEFIRCICLEQKFLKLFPEAYVIHILSGKNRHWKEAVDNICEPVLTCMAGHILAGKALTDAGLQDPEYAHMQKLLMGTSAADIKKQLEDALGILVKDYYEDDRELLEYLSGAVGGITARLKNAAENHVLSRLI